MIRSLMSAASGMQAQQLNIDTIANNLANVNTAGFKKSQVLFEDMLYENIRAPGGTQGGGQSVPAGAQVGLGARTVSIAKVFSPGKFQVTNRDLDVAIEGQGFFEVTLPGSDKAYTRDGAFSKTAEGKLVNADGYEITGGPTLSSNATAVTIAPNGTVSEVVNGITAEKGTISLFRFVNPSGLSSIGRNLFQESSASGTATSGVGGVDGFGTIQQGILETSNVEVVEEMVNLIVAQRAYEVNTKAVQASDEMLQATNNMKR